MTFAGTRDKKGIFLERPPVRGLQPPEFASSSVSDHLNLYFFEGSPDRILAR